MANDSALNATAAAIVSLCHQGHPPDRLKAEVLDRLRAVVPIDAIWWATSDPATLLFTQAFREGIPDRTTPYFVDNEFLATDVNQWTALAQDPDGVGTLVGATDGDLEASARFRDVFAPLGLGDELRAVLRSGGSCWGLMCLHREAGRSFSHREVKLVRQLAPHLAEGIRAGLLTANVASQAATDAPGLVVLDQGGEIVAVTAAAQAWFAELGNLGRSTDAATAVPAEVGTAAALLRRSAGAGAPVPRLRVRTRAGRWVVLHASWLSPSGEHDDRHQIAVIIEPATPLEVASVIMRAYGLTERERAVTGLVCRGRSTVDIAAELWISANTVQDHLKSIFDKTGVRSRRALMAAILRDHYLPALGQSRPVSPTGFFE